MDLLTEDDGFTSGLLLGEALEFKVVSSAADEGLIEGYASVFGGIDSHGDTVAPGAFADTLAAHISAKSAPAMLWHHRPTEPIGKWTAMGEDARGLRVRGKLNLDTSMGKRVHSHVKAGDVTGLSIGYVPNPGGTARGQQGGRVLKSVRLHEVSILPMPSDGAARILEVKSLASRSELQDLLEETGLPKAAAKKIAAAGWRALSGEEPEAKPDPRLAQLITKAAAMTAEIKEAKSCISAIISPSSLPVPPRAFS